MDKRTHTINVCLNIVENFCEIYLFVSNNLIQTR